VINAQRESGPIKGRYLLGLLRLVGIVLLVVVIAKFGVREIWRYLEQADGGAVVVAVMLQLCVIALKGLRWHVLQGSTGRGAGITANLGSAWESYAFGVVTPGRVGEFLKIGHATRRSAVVVESGVLALGERFVDLGVFTAAAGTGLALGALPAGRHFCGWALLALGLGVVGVGYALFVSQAVDRSLLGLLTRVRLAKITAVDQPAKCEAGEALLALSLSVVATLAYFVSCFFLAIAVSLKLSFGSVSGIVSLAGLLGVLPITVMGLGTREIVFLYLLEGFPSGQVLAFSVLVFVVAQLGGAIIALALGELCLFLSSKKNIES
jgi:uncharacterized membrane protein YbhN (UPF0104 family)